MKAAASSIRLSSTSSLRLPVLSRGRPFFLTDNARAIITMRHWGSFLYVAAGLCVIFIFWSRSIIHTLTVIRWPMEFGHNFFYIGFALGEAIL